MTGTRPPKIHDKAKVAVLAAAALALSAFLVFYYFADPESRWMPRCFFKAVTGYDCPGCGFQRALHAALHGDIAAAWHLNPFVFFAIPTGALYIAADSLRFRYPRLHARINHPLILTALLLSIVTFWVVRNL